MKKNRVRNFVNAICSILLPGLFLLTACNPAVVTPTPQGDPLSLTPEVFNPLDPSPTSSGSDLPLSCQVTDLNVQIERNYGYCFAYPKRFSTGTQSMLGIPAVLGPSVGGGADPVFASFAVGVSTFDPTISLDQQVDDFLKDFSVVDPVSLVHTQVIVGGEPAIQVDQIPVQLSWRIVFVQHAGNLFRLMYWPVDVAEAKADIDELYQTTIGSFAFLNTEPLAESDMDDSIQISLETGKIATGFEVETVAAVPADGISPYWEVMPEFTRVTLQEYSISNHAMQPQIFIYPVKDLASSNENAGKVLADLQSLLQTQLAGDELPFLPLINGKQVIHPQVQFLDFNGGAGVRSLTQFNQGIVMINNNQLIYTFQGLTNDGKYYVAAILPVTHPDLPDTEQVFAQAEGELKDYPAYMAETITWLEQQPGNSFTPSILDLDAMIISLVIK